MAFPVLTQKAVTKTIVPAITDLINSWKRPLVGAFMRLAFHDCAGTGGCDGCVNTSLAENKGLEVPVQALEWLYFNRSFHRNISRADLWALAGMVAAGTGMKKKNPKNYTLPNLVNPKYFKYGRQDCKTAPNSPSDLPSDFPSAFIGNAAVLSYFSTRFAFDARQTVAIMGAHHLGRMHQEYSGFNGPWVPDQAMDGGYYRNLLNVSANWHQKFVNTSLAPYDTKVQWVDNRGSPCLNMLNADMALYKDITPPLDNGAVKCTYETCPNATATQPYVKEFAKNATTFREAFSSVYDLMTSICGHPASGPPTMCSLKMVACPC